MNDETTPGGVSTPEADGASLLPLALPRKQVASSSTTGGLQIKKTAGAPAICYSTDDMLSQGLSLVQAREFAILEKHCAIKSRNEAYQRSLATLEKENKRRNMELVEYKKDIKAIVQGQKDLDQNELAMDEQYKACKANFRQKRRDLACSLIQKKSSIATTKTWLEEIDLQEMMVKREISEINGSSALFKNHPKPDINWTEMERKQVLSLVKIYDFSIASISDIHGVLGFSKLSAIQHLSLPDVKKLYSALESSKCRSQKTNYGSNPNFVALCALNKHHLAWIQYGCVTSGKHKFKKYKSSQSLKVIKMRFALFTQLEIDCVLDDDDEQERKFSKKRCFEEEEHSLLLETEEARVCQPSAKKRRIQE